MTRVFAGGTRPCFGVLQAKAGNARHLVGSSNSLARYFEAFNPRLSLCLESKKIGLLIFLLEFEDAFPIEH